MRTNVSVLLYCNVTGYPFPQMRRHGPVDIFQARSERKFNDTNPYYAQSPWYSVYKVDVPPEMVTRNFSGNYSCTGEVNVFQDGITDKSTVVLTVTAYGERCCMDSYSLLPHFLTLFTLPSRLHPTLLSLANSAIQR